jgi:hypothetical protein
VLAGEVGVVESVPVCVEAAFFFISSLCFGAPCGEVVIEAVAESVAEPVAVWEPVGTVVEAPFSFPCFFELVVTADAVDDADSEPVGIVVAVPLSFPCLLPVLERVDEAEAVEDADLVSVPAALGCPSGPFP